MANARSLNQLLAFGSCGNRKEGAPQNRDRRRQSPWPARPSSVRVSRRKMRPQTLLRRFGDNKDDAGRRRIRRCRTPAHQIVDGHEQRRTDRFVLPAIMSACLRKMVSNASSDIGMQESRIAMRDAESHSSRRNPRSDRFDGVHFGDVVAEHVFDPVLQRHRRRRASCTGSAQVQEHDSRAAVESLEDNVAAIAGNRGRTRVSISSRICATISGSPSP